MKVLSNTPLIFSDFQNNGWSIPQSSQLYFQIILAMLEGCFLALYMDSDTFIWSKSRDGKAPCKTISNFLCSDQEMVNWAKLLWHIFIIYPSKIWKTLHHKLQTKDELIRSDFFLACRLLRCIALMVVNCHRVAVTQTGWGSRTVWVQVGQTL